MRKMFSSILVAGIMSLPSLAPCETAWPTKTIRFVVPFAAGGQIDTSVRLLASRLEKDLGASIVVENRAGADGLIGTETVARSPADGYTWIAQATPFTVMPSIHGNKLRYDTIKDFQPVSIFATSSILYVVPSSLPLANLDDFLAFARKQDGAVSYGGSTRGSLAHLSGEMLKQATGIKMESIPYPGMAPAMGDLKEGRTQFMAVGMAVALPFIHSGGLRPLAVLDDSRHPLLPDVPTIAELGYPSLAVAPWFGILVPGGTPGAITQRIATAVSGALANDELADKLRTYGIEPAKQGTTPEEFTEKIRSDIERWRAVLNQMGTAGK